MFSPFFLHQFFYQYFSIKKKENKFIIGKKAFFLNIKHVKKIVETNITWFFMKLSKNISGKNWCKHIGEKMWWADQKIVNGDKQKKKRRRTKHKVNSVAFLKFLLQYQEILLITTTLHIVCPHFWSTVLQSLQSTDFC